MQRYWKLRESKIYKDGEKLYQIDFFDNIQFYDGPAIGGRCMTKNEFYKIIDWWYGNEYNKLSKKERAKINY
jgi:hypothetical protein